MKFKIKKFDMASIPEDKVVVMVGARGNGKSVLIRDLLFYHQDMPIGVVISPTEEVNRFYNDIVPKQFIHHEWSSELIEKMINRQKMIIKKQEKEVKHNGASKIDPRAFLILDDCMYDNTWTRDKYMRFVFQNGRHVKLFAILSAQYMMNLPPDIRTNIDYTFVMRENNLANRQRLYTNFAGCIPTFQMFCSIMDECTEDYGCLVIHNSAKSNKLHDQVYWYRADLHTGYRLGADVFWDMQQDESDSDGEPEFDPSIYTQKRSKGPRVNIKKSA